MRAPLLFKASLLYPAILSMAFSSPLLTDEGWLVEPVMDVNRRAGATQGTGIVNQSEGAAAAAHDRFYFSVDYPSTGSELWSTDGTPLGTAPLKELLAGSTGGSPRSLVAWKNDLFFFGAAPDAWSALYALREPGAEYERLATFGDLGSTQLPTNLTPTDDLLFWSCATSASITELWRSDGTPEGTRVVYTLSEEGRFLPQSDGARPIPPAFYLSNFMALGNQVAFSLARYGGVAELWRSDGTPEGTGPVFADSTGDWVAEPLVSGGLGNQIYFPLRSADGSRYRLWVNDAVDDQGHEVPLPDGTAGNINRILRFHTGASVIYVVAEVNGVLSLFYTSGQSLLPLPPLSTASGEVFTHSVSIGDDLYFAGNLDTPILWRIRPGLTSYEQVPLDSLQAGERLYDLQAVEDRWIHVLTGPHSATRIHQLDLRTGETRLLVDESLDGSSWLHHQGIVGNDHYFATFPGANATDLWRVDAASGATHHLYTNRTPSMASNPLILHPFGERLAFSALDTDGRNGVWTTRGTSETTTLLWRHPEPGTDKLVLGIGSHLDRLYIHAHDGDGVQLLTSDGTPEGTRQVEGELTSPEPTFIELIGGLGGRYFFSAGGGSGVRVWGTDGTDDGTRALSWPPGVSSVYRVFAGPSAVYNGELYLAATTQMTEELQVWKIPEEGDSLIAVATIEAPGAPYNFLPTQFLQHDGLLYFASQGVPYCGFCGAGPAKLLVTDGTASGSAVSTFYTEFSDSRPMLSLGGALLVGGRGDANGVELWRGDGLAEPTALIADLRPGAAFSKPSDLVELDAAAIFRMTTSEYLPALWRTDGTTSGTLPIQTYRSMAGNWGPQLVNTGNAVVFPANDGITGLEIWKTDGRTAEVLAQTVMGSPGIIQHPPIVAGDFLYFTASNDDGVAPENGTELYAIPLSIVNDMDPPAVSVAATTERVDLETTITIGIEFSELSSPIEPSELELQNLELVALVAESPTRYRAVLRAMAHGPATFRVAEHAVRDYGANWNEASNLFRIQVRDPARGLGWLSY